MVDCLAGSGAALELRDGDSDTPLHLAACGTDGKGHPAVVEVLLKRGADPRAKRRNGKTASTTTKAKALREMLHVAEVSFDEQKAEALREERRLLMLTSKENMEIQRKRREALLAAKRKALAPLQAEPNKKKATTPPPKSLKSPQHPKKKSPKRAAPKADAIPHESKRPRTEAVEGYPGWEARTTADGTYYVELSRNDIHWEHPKELGAHRGNEAQEETRDDPMATASGDATAGGEAMPTVEGKAVAAAESATAAQERQEDPRREVLLQAVFGCGSNGKEEATLLEIVAAAGALSGAQETYTEAEVEALCNELQDQNRVMIADGVVYYVL